MPYAVTKAGVKKWIPPNAGKGRPKGVKNKYSSIKEIFVRVLDDLGGEEWVKSHAKTQHGRRDFFNAIVKMIPNKSEFTGASGGPIKIEMKKPLSAMTEEELLELKEQLLGGAGE